MKTALLVAQSLYPRAVQLEGCLYDEGVIARAHAHALSLDLGHCLALDKVT